LSESIKLLSWQTEVKQYTFTNTYTPTLTTNSNPIHYI